MLNAAAARDSLLETIEEKGENGGDPIDDKEFCILKRRFTLVVSS